MPIPKTSADLDSKWLSLALNQAVVASEIVDAHSGTTGRVALKIRFADDPERSRRLFVKLPPTDDMQKAFVTSSGMGRREALFYSQLSQDVPVRVPGCYYATSDSSGEQYVMVLEDLEESGCTFRSASASYSLEYIRAVLASFADLHAAYWLSPRFDTDLSWIEPPLQHAIAVQLVEVALSTFGTQMPPVFTQMGELYLAHTDAIHGLWNEGAYTLIHGDVHDGNLFFDGDTPGFLDWALTAKAPGMRDVGYFLAGAMKPEDRQLHQHSMLDYYRERLLMHGVDAPSRDELWLQYQWHVAYVWVGAAVTLAMGEEWLPTSYTLKSLERINQALDDLGSIAAFEARLTA